MNTTTHAIVKGPDEKYCAECGAIIRAKAEICPKCGVRQAPIASAATSTAAPGYRSKFTAAMCSLFLGGIGMHKFYLGENKAGVFYALFFWTFIPAVIGFFEALQLLFMSEDAFNAKYNYR